MINIELDIKDLIAPTFYDLSVDVETDKHTHYFIKGGRGSTKSSFVSIEIIFGMMADERANAIVFRKFGTDLKESVFNQLLWAIDMLEVTGYWESKLSPLRLIYKPTGQEILFRGVDDPQKPKSIKLRKGYFKFIWYEEADQYEGMEEIRIINQSLLRSEGKAKVFYTYNPPKSVQSWINREVLIQQDNRLIHHSTYLDVPREWLGDIFFAEAGYLKGANETAYNHEYLGEVTGTGGEVFDNVVIKEITDDEIKSFDNIHRGLDFGFSVDPCAYVECYLHNYKLYIFREYYIVGAGYDALSENIGGGTIYADSAEPRSIFELQQRGLKVVPAIKGNGSVNFGIRKLQDLREIIIDNKRCPNTAREFLEYEIERDKNGNFKAEFPDKNNHCIVGETLIDTTAGQAEIKSLVGRKIDVFCYDESNGEKTTAKAFDIRMTRETAAVYEIELEDGRTIKATAEHLIYTQNGWQEAGKLTEGDCILDILGGAK